MLSPGAIENHATIALGPQGAHEVPGLQEQQTERVLVDTLVDDAIQRVQVSADVRGFLSTMEEVLERPAVHQNRLHVAFLDVLGQQMNWQISPHLVVAALHQ